MNTIVGIDNGKFEFVLGYNRETDSFNTKTCELTDLVTLRTLIIEHCLDEDGYVSYLVSSSFDCPSMYGAPEGFDPVAAINASIAADVIEEAS